MIFIVNGEKILLAIEEDRLTIEVLKELTIPRNCPSCSQKGLSRHGSYWREIELDGRLCSIPIQRVRCLKCGSSGSCLYDFMIPYCRRGADDIAAAMDNQDQSRPKPIPASSRARWIVNLLNKLPSAILNLHQTVVEVGISPLSLPTLHSCTHLRGSDEERFKQHLFCYFRKLTTVLNLSSLDLIVETLRAPYLVTDRRLDDRLPSPQGLGKVPGIHAHEVAYRPEEQFITKYSSKKHKKVKRLGKDRGSNVHSPLPRTNSEFFAAI